MSIFKHFSVCCLGALILSSCQVYRTNFDCCAGRGVPCTPVTDIEKMIIETPEGSPDIFLGYLPSQSPKCEKNCHSNQLQQRRVWITGKMQPCGLYIDGHYIYLQKKVLP